MSFGDEVGAIVLDPGSHLVRAGFAGLDTPLLVVPSVYSTGSDGSTRYGDRVTLPRADTDVVDLYKDAEVLDWDAVTGQWQQIIGELRGGPASERPLLVTEPVWNLKKNRVKTLEVALETLEFAGTYMVRQPSAVAMALGRGTCLVVDVGCDTAVVTTVVDGLTLVKATMRTHYAGRYLQKQIQTAVEERTEVVPWFRVRSKVPTSGSEAPNWTPKELGFVPSRSYDAFGRRRVWEEIAEAAVVVSGEPEEARRVELPTGYSVTLTDERRAWGNSLFDPVEVPGFASENGEPVLKGGNDYRPVRRKRKDEDGTPGPDKDVPAVRGLTQLVLAQLALIDVDLRPQLANNIVVTGGTSLVPGLTERLQSELVAAHPGLKVRLHAAGNSVERRYALWVGGTVLASVGTFHQMWVGRREWEEEGGERLLQRRFR